MSTQRPKHSQCTDDIFSYLLLLTAFFFLVEIGFFIQCNRGYLSDYTFVSDHLHIPATILPGVFGYVAVQLGVHLIFCVFAWLVSRGCILLLSIPRNNQLVFAMVIWCLLMMTMLSANQYFYPNSKFARLTSLLMLDEPLSRIIFYSFICISSVIVVCGFCGLINSYLAKKWLIVFVIMVPMVIFGGQYFSSGQNHPYTSSATAERPNIILIGVDSLRPDFVGMLGGDYATPFIDSFLENSVVFSEAITPLARTFPSWMSILNGQYPRELHIRTNLTNLAGRSFPSSLPAILKAHGYETIYASDETRFSNIDHQLGFDQILTPPMGLNDFLLGSFNDFPLTNLVVNSNLGKLLLPFSYANRAVYFSYHPDAFIARLSKALLNPHPKPLFLAAHFCLPHYPYLYANLNGEGISPQERYVASIIRVDQQLNQFYNLLQSTGLLDHSIVVLLSDHGEALELSGDRITEPELFVPKDRSAPLFYPPTLEGEAMNQSAGHGTDVLGLPQYHSLLAFQLTGVQDQMMKPRTVQGVVSLIDIKPTILSLLNIQPGESSGISLGSIITNSSDQPPLRHLVLESDFSSEAIRTVYPEIRKVMLEGIDLFEINAKTTRLTVKPSMVAKIIQSKQYADLYGEWMLAVYPKNKQQRIAILINLNTGRWTDDLTSDFAAASPAMLMWSHLTTFYGAEVSPSSVTPH